MAGAGNRPQVGPGVDGTLRGATGADVARGATGARTAHRATGARTTHRAKAPRRVAATLTASALAAAPLVGVGVATAPPAQAATTEFTYTGTLETWQVPEGVTSITLELAGGSGANLNGLPVREGRGAILTWDSIAVSADVECTFAIGQGGQVDVSDTQNSPGGGAASYVICSDGSASVFEAIAGGGGGASVADGGDGGTPTGGDGASGGRGTTGGGGGSNTTPGSGGSPGETGGDNGATAGTIGGAGGQSIAGECPGVTPGGAGGANPNPIYAGGDGGGLCAVDGRGGSGGGGGSFGGGGGNGSSLGWTSGGGGGASQWFVAPSSTGYQDYLLREGSGRDGYASVTYTALPGAPMDLSAIGGDAEATISFTPGSDGYTDITNYGYTVDDGMTWTALNPAQAASPVTVSGLRNGTTYQIALRTVNTVGLSPASEPVTVTPGLPAAPTNLAATPGNSSAVVGFTPGADNGSPITNYQYSLDAGTTWVTVAPPLTGPPLVITGLTNGTTYNIAVRAVNTNGPGSPSAPVSVTPSTLPPAPTGLTATPGNESLILAFTQPSSGGSPITNYQYSLDGSAWASFDPPATASPITLGGLVDGTEYTVAIRAVNANGVSSATPTVTAIAATTPAAPTDLVAQVADGQAPVSFTAPADDGSSVITNYEYSLDDGANWTAFDPPATESPVTITGLTNGTSYSVTLRAVNEAGAGAASAPVAVTPAAVPLAPTNVVANPGVGSVGLTFTNADPNGEPILGYEYSIDGGGEWLPFVPMITDSPAIITGLPAGEEVQVSLRAFNGLGAGAASVPVPVTPLGVPGEMEVVLALPADEAIALIFGGPSSSGGTPVTNYEYTLDGGATWIPFDPPVTSSFHFTVVGPVVNGQTYGVAVRALNAVGPGPESPVQQVIAGTPFPPFIELSPGDGALSIEFAPGIDDNGSPITSFEYSLDGGSTWITTDPPLATSPIVVDGLVNGQTYVVALRAVNARGAGTSSSIIELFDPTGRDTVTVGTPSAPTELVASAGDGQVTVSFSVGADNGSPITNYEYSLDFGTTWTPLEPAEPSSPVTITGLTNGVGVEIGLRGVNSRGSGAVGVVYAMAGIPSAPTDLLATPGDQQVGISFTPGANNGSPITNYEYSTDGGENWSVFDPPQDSSPVTVAGLVNGTAYEIALRAVNARGIGEGSGSVMATPRTTPDAPTALTATPGYGEVTVGFTAPASDGGAEITNYEYSLDGGVTWAVFAPAVTAEPVEIGGLTNGTTYQIALRAVNEAGAGAASDVVAVAPLGAQFAAVSPYRAYDSRLGDGPLAPGQSRTVSTDVPAGSVAVACNLTATGMTGSGYLAVTPAGAPTPPTSTLNFTAPGQTWANGFTSGVNEAGEITVMAAGASTEFVVDVLGYYFPPVAAGDVAAAGAAAGDAGAQAAGDVAAAGAAAGDAAVRAAAGDQADGTLFVPITPTRAYDSRSAEGPLVGGQARTVDVSAGGAVPAEATAVAYTLTETGTVGRGFLSVGPAGGAPPQVSTINWFTSGQTTANSSVVAIDGGAVEVSAGSSQGGSAQFVIDVLGYYVSAGSAPAEAMAFTPIDPARAYDSRVDQPLGPISGGEDFTTSMAVAGVPADAGAVAYNLTIAGTGASGFLTTVPGDVVSLPPTSTINWWQSRQTLANGSVVGVAGLPVMAEMEALGTLGLPVTTFARGGSTQYVIDVAGYFTPAVTGTPGPPGGEENTGPGPSQVTFDFAYLGGSALLSEPARRALEAAAANFASNVQASAPVTVNVGVTAAQEPMAPWLVRSTAELTSSGPGFHGSVVREKILTGVDSNGTGLDMTMEWNMALSWALGDDVGSDQYDLPSVAMREFARAFGFASNLAQPGTNDGRNWTLFDGYLVDDQGGAPIDGQFQWLSAYDANLTGGNGGLYFGGPNAVAAFGGLVPLHTPDPWAQGQSVSHLAPQVGDWLTAGEVSKGPGPRTLSPVERAILADLGYVVAS